MFRYYNQEKQLGVAVDIFNKAKEHSVFYKEKFKDYEKIENIEEWRSLPFLTRDELFKNTFPHSTSMVTQPIEDMIVSSTGGSSQIARYTLLTHKEFDRFAIAQAEALRIIGIKPQDLVANLLVAGSLWPSFLGVEKCTEKLKAVSLPISANIEVERILKFILEFKPTVLLSLPTLFVFLADLVLKEKLKLDFVRIIGYAGEHMSSAIRKHLKNAFGDNITIRAIGYSSGDCGLMGYQCPYCAPNEYHIPTDFQFIEIYNFEENRYCDYGETGEVIVTNLARTSMPIIKYRLGDLAKIEKRQCACGDKNPLLILKGRSGDDFKLGGSYISMSSIDNVVEHFVDRNGISANYTLEIEDVRENKMDFVLKIESANIESSKTFTRDIEEALKSSINDLKVGVDMGYINLVVQFVELGKLNRSPITGKVKHLNDKRAKE